ncbi:MAG TPA: LacI family DNA-binding transcriptional regulator [Woeseiaceae bacterium]|nr:LacI family DNA-binding transcriptional regulator [Woeseiaceae bacterium]
MASKRQLPARKQHARVTISDVAREARVSPMTVSRVINDDARVRQSTRDAVNAAIRDLGYLPNKAARSLASASQVQIGMLYDNPSSSYLSAMLLGVLEQARRSDTQIVVVECENEADGMRCIRNMVKTGIDGILLSPPLADAEAVLALLKETGVQCVTIGTRRDEPNVSSVAIDDFAAARLMTEHIIRLGHRRIGFIKGSPDQLATPQRLAGYREALANAGIDYDSELVVDGRFSYRSGLAAAEELLALPDRPTAIFASNDDMAAATVATAHRHHVDIPRDLTVCGFDDTLLATTIWPEITTIHQPITAMSQAAIDLLEKRIRAVRSGQEEPRTSITLDFRFVQRASDAPPGGYR